MSYRIKTSDITASAGLPLKKGSLDLLMTEFGDIARMISMTANGANTTMIVSGVVPTVSGSSWSFTQGWVYYSNQFYFVNATSFTLGVGQIPVLTVATEYIMGSDEDPVTFTDGNSHNVHQLNYMTISSGASGSGTLNWESVQYWNTPWGPIGTTTGAWFTNWSTRKPQARIHNGQLILRGSAPGNIFGAGTSIGITGGVFPFYFFNGYGTFQRQKAMVWHNGSLTTASMICSTDGTDFQLAVYDITGYATSGDLYNLDGIIFTLTPASY